MLALLLIVATLTGPPATDLLGLADCPPGSELPPEWRLRPVSGVPVPDFRVNRLAGERVLRVHGRSAAAWAYRELDMPLAAEEGTLRWAWRALELPDGADLALESSDDAPLRVYVVFGKPSLLGRSRAIFYSWGETTDGGRARKAFESDRIAVVPVAGGTADGQWRAESVRPFDDFRRIWGGEPPPIRIVGVMQDTDDTGSAAIAELRALFWEPTPLDG